MLDILKVIIIGIVQGITEFLPISSSAHTYILYSYMDLNFLDPIILQAFLHLGTLISVVIFFNKKIFLYLNSFIVYHFSFTKATIHKQNALFARYIIYATIPIAVVGYFFEEILEKTFYNPIIISICLFVVGVLFFVVEKISKQTKTELIKITKLQAFLIGCSQVIALIPGVSRSGITIITGMFLNLNRKVSAEFTFLLAIPTILGVATKKIVDVYKLQKFDENIFLYLIAIVTSAIIGYFCIKYFINFVSSKKLAVFGYYRIILAIIIFIWTIF